MCHDGKPGSADFRPSQTKEAVTAPIASIEWITAPTFVSMRPSAPSRWQHTSASGRSAAEIMIIFIKESFRWKNPILLVNVKPHFRFGFETHEKETPAYPVSALKREVARRVETARAEVKADEALRHTIRMGRRNCNPCRR